MLGVMLGFFVFSGNIPRICHSVLGALRGLLAFFGQIPSVSPRVLGALLGLAEGITKKPAPALIKNIC